MTMTIGFFIVVRLESSKIGAADKAERPEDRRAAWSGAVQGGKEGMTAISSLYAGIEAVLTDLALTRKETEGGPLAGRIQSTPKPFTLVVFDTLTRLGGLS